MTDAQSDNRPRVGPVLAAGQLSDDIVAAIQSLNFDVNVVNRGAYRRISAPGRCLVTAAAVETLSGRPFHLPGDLEQVMPSFAGRISVNEERAIWLAPGEEAT